jgi:hypothetical protein
MAIIHHSPLSLSRSKNLRIGSTWLTGASILNDHLHEKLPSRAPYEPIINQQWFRSTARRLGVQAVFLDRSLALHR